MQDLTNDKTTGYHLFLEPAGALKVELEGIISALAKEYGGPIFVPHVTILARIQGTQEEVLEKAAQLSKESSPLTLTLGTLNAEPVSFRALYCIIREQLEVRTLHARANELFSMLDQAPYLAHLSFLYGDYDHARKEKTMSELKYPTGESFVADTLYVYRTEGKPGEWFPVKEFPLGG